MIDDAELAGRYFDEQQASGLRRDGMPEEGIAYLRQRYIHDACANPEAVRQLREMYAGGVVAPTTIVKLPPMTYRPCPDCAAPIVSPFPDTWTFDLIKEGPRSDPVVAFGTPHRDTCGAPLPTPEPGIAVRTSGAYVSHLDIGIAT
jgi:hypothetical protein